MLNILSRANSVKLIKLVAPSRSTGGGAPARPAAQGAGN
jgi:hypothetical protein